VNAVSRAIRRLQLELGGRVVERDLHSEIEA